MIIFSRRSQLPELSFSTFDIAKVRRFFTPTMAFHFFRSECLRQPCKICDTFRNNLLNVS